MTEVDRPDVPADRKRRWQIVGYAIGLLLFMLAIFAVVTQGDVFVDAMSNIGDAPFWLISLAFILPLLNWLVVSLSLWTLTSAYGRVGLWEMTALLANAWLLNYLPLRPGMAGRITYHKLVNRIRVRDSAKVVLQATAMTGISLVILGAIALGLGDRFGAQAWAIALAAPVVVLGLTALALARHEFMRRMTLALLLRHIDMLVWVARYAVVFALIDQPLGLVGAVIFAMVSQIAMLVPFTGNGLGVREWFIGQTAVLGIVAGLDHQAIGLTADLMNRAGGLAVSIPVGLSAAWWVSRRLARFGGESAPADPEPREIAPEDA